MESFATNFNDFYPSTIITKLSILDACRGPSYDFEIRFLTLEKLKKLEDDKKKQEKIAIKQEKDLRANVELEEKQLIEEDEEKEQVYVSFICLH